MASISLHSSATLPSLSPNSRRSANKQEKKSSNFLIFASKREADRDRNNYYRGGGWTVDENLIVLRKRIHETKMMERNYEPPAEWMDWEKSCYVSYDSVICEALGVVQSQLMNTRPSLALALVAMISMSLPFSTAVILFRFLEMTNDALTVIHLP